MGRKKIEVLVSAFRDGFQTILDGKVITKDFLPAIEAAKNVGLSRFEIGGGARFQSSFLYCNENAFDMMDAVRETVGSQAELQTLSRSINLVGTGTQPLEIIDLQAKLFKKHGITCIRNFDALNNLDNLKLSGRSIVNYGLDHQIGITLMEFPEGFSKLYDVSYYEKLLNGILDKDIPYNSICFKDTIGTTNPRKVYEIMKMAKRILPSKVPLWFHTHETAGLSVSSYLSAIEAGVDGIDLSLAPVAGGISQPSVLTLLKALKGSEFDLGFDAHKIAEVEEIFCHCLEDYILAPEAFQVSNWIWAIPLPGHTINSGMKLLKREGLLSKIPEFRAELLDVISKSGCGAAVAPFSRFYFNQVLNNLLHGAWRKIDPGYARLILGYFGELPSKPDQKVIELVADYYGMKSYQGNPLDMAEKDPMKGIKAAKQMLNVEQLEETEENIFIVASCGEKGIRFLKGEALTDVPKRLKREQVDPELVPDGYTVSVNGTDYGVVVEESAVVVNGKKYSIEITEGVTPAHAVPDDN
ncbi:biotin attachment protein [Candidatus Margulisiibacteriota bacterium]